MNITATTISLTVDGFVSPARDDTATNAAADIVADANITMPLREEPWGERLFQATEPNGIVLQLVEWSTQS